MTLPVGDPFLRLSFDSLYLFAQQETDSSVVLVAINERTDRALGRQQGEPLSRSHHARLVQRLKEAGCERICYDILFDLPSNNPAADEELRKVIDSHGRVVLGGVQDLVTHENTAQAQVIPPFDDLRSAAEGWGILNLEPVDADGAVRRFSTDWELAQPLSFVAAKCDKPALNFDSFPPEAWIRFTAPPGGIPTYELSESLNPASTPDHVFSGKTVFIGGNYQTDEYGRRDVYATPYSRFGIAPMSGVELHANLFLNARDQLWFRQLSPLASIFWCLPLAICAPLMVFWRRPVLNILIALGIAVGLSAFALLSIWNGSGFFSWLVPLSIQFPLVAAFQLSLNALRKKVRFLEKQEDPGLDDLVVFISFSRNDLEIAEEICELLNENERKAWIYKDRLPAGAHWPEHLSRALETCQMVLFLLSKDSLNSTLCMRELNIASTEGKPILPIRLDDSKISNKDRLLMGFEQRVDATRQPKEETFRELLKAVDRVLTQKSE